MKKFIEIDKQTARNILISNQFSFEKSSYRDKALLHKLIEKLSYVQIDTISVVERSHHHILWSRMKAYEKTKTDELLEKDKLIFEYWAHAASYLPMKDYRFSLIRKRRYSKKYKTWGSANKKIIKRVLDRIKSEGPMQSRDFEDNRKIKSGWWDWKPSKDALDYLFHSGELMVSKRSGFQKVYDLTERVLPVSVNTEYPSETELYKNLIFNSINANGFACESDIMYQRKYDKKLFAKIITELIEDKKLFEMRIAGLESSRYYLNPDSIIEKKFFKDSKVIHILSPFDNLLIDRKKLLKIFDFDYQLECYLPKQKRKFGYFCLPILYKNNFMGRIDLKADRKKRIMYVNNIFFEKNFRKSKEFENKLNEKLNELAAFCGCNEVKKLN